MTTCANHPTLGAVAYCRTCGKPLCEGCKREVRGVIYCEECLAARLQDTVPPVDAAGATGVPPIPPIPPVNLHDLPNPGLATFLGFIPGVGAMYNGQIAKGLVHIVIFAMLTAAADRADIFGFFVAAFFAYMVIDANKTAKARLHGYPLPDYLGINALVGEFGGVSSPRQVVQGVSQAVDRVGQRPNRPPIAAFVLIGFGVLFLLDNMGVLGFRWMNRFWPVMLIVVGVWSGVRRWERSSRNMR